MNKALFKKSIIATLSSLILLLIFNTTNTAKADEKTYEKYELPLKSSKVRLHLMVPEGYKTIKSMGARYFMESGYSYVLIKNEKDSDLIEVEIKKYPNHHQKATGRACYELEKEKHSDLQPIIIKKANGNTYVNYCDSNKCYNYAFLSDGTDCVKISLIDEIFGKDIVDKEIKSEEIETIFVGDLDNFKEKYKRDYRENFMEEMRKENANFGKSYIKITDNFNRSIADLVKKGWKLDTEGQFEAAEIMYEKIIKMDNIFKSIERYTDRRVTLTKIKKIFDRKFPVNKKDYDQIKKLYWSEIKMYPNNHMNYYYLAEIYSREGNKVQTLLNLRRALQLHDFKENKEIKWYRFDRYTNDSDFQNLLERLLPYRIKTEFINGTAVATDHKGQFLHIKEENMEPLYNERFYYVTRFHEGVSRATNRIGEHKVDSFFINKKGERIKALDEK